MRSLLIILVILPQLTIAQLGVASEEILLPITISPSYKDSHLVSRPSVKQPAITPALDTLLPMRLDNSLDQDSLEKLFPKPYKLTAKKIAIPITLIAMGFATMGKRPIVPMNAEIQEEIQEHYPGFQTKIDDYTQYVPVAVTYGLNLAGIKGQHGYFNLTGIFVLSNFLNSAVTKQLKKCTNQLRPDNSTYDAFPSGHTSSAFSVATILFLEYKDKSIWYGIAGYGLATATGTLRLFNNKHWISDVIAGAGVGMLTAKTAYAVYPWLLKKVNQEFPRLGYNQQLLITPMYANGSVGLGVVYVFK